MKLVVAALFVLINITSLAQNKFLIGSKAYNSTPSFTLTSNAKAFGHDLEVTILRNSKTGMIALSTDVFTDGVRIAGKALIYLDDNTVISCIDRGNFDFVDNTATTIYYLTEDEIVKMKNSNISVIRFNIKCYNCMISSEEGTFSAKLNSHLKDGYFFYERHLLTQRTSSMTAFSASD